ncbi:centaurin-gamma-1A-like isoform X4 [Argopecten irradians]|uniref:centaurin-gamma-1A-like isoform X4 n=1 Tax=Argopecten irradians TaxID=31199 RepID=UPI00371E8A35
MKDGKDGQSTKEKDKSEKKKDKQQQQQQMLTESQEQEEDRVDFNDIPPSTPLSSRKNKKSSIIQKSNSFSGPVDRLFSSHPVSTPILHRKNSKFLKNSFLTDKTEARDLPTPSSTPTQSRKNRRRSNLFNPKNKEEEKVKTLPETEKLGSGRVIPLKQGYLYKKSHGLNKEWKKKYVTLLDDARLAYHPSLHDYMDDVHKKEISLMHTTVKIPGLRPRTTKTVPNYPPQHPNQDPANGLKRVNGNSVGSKLDTPNVKKRHRRAKSGGLKSMEPGAGDESDGYEFMIVSLENKQWHFEANNHEERDDWITAIEQQIFTALQGNESCKTKKVSATDPDTIPTMRNTRGNSACADCGAPSPDWASLNLGTLICIECSGIHRNLGTHLSRVRSLDLDEWPPDLTKVMISIGNSTANSVWEAHLKGKTKPSPSSPREEKERWIRAKYDTKEFLPPAPYLDISLNQQLIDALVREDIRNIVLVLGHSTAEDINAPYSKDDGRTALHIAAALGNVVYVQLLLWYSANVKVVDHEGRNALWYAKSSGSTDCVELLMNSGCPEHPTLPRRRGSAQPGKNDVFEKLPASVI